MMTAKRLVVANERSAERRLHTQRFEKPARDPESRQPLGISAIDKVRIPPCVCRKEVQGVRLRPPVKEIRGRDRFFLEFEVWCGLGEQDDRIGVFERIRPEHQPIDEIENRGIRAEAERQRDRHREREERTLRQRTKAVPDFGEHVWHGSSAGSRRTSDEQRSI
jgi:hypothetical protein